MAASWRTSTSRDHNHTIGKTDAQYRWVLLARCKRTRAYFHKQERREKTPHLPLGGMPTNRSPTDGLPRLRRPDPPSGRFPFFRCDPHFSERSRLPPMKGAAFFDLDRIVSVFFGAIEECRR